MCCQALSTKYSRSADQQAGDIKVAYSQISKAYQQKAVQLEAQATAGGSGTPIAGGISITDLLNQQQNADRLPTQFNIGMTDSALPVPAVGNQPDEGIGGDGNPGTQL
jgi:hypothetical protein